MPRRISNHCRSKLDGNGRKPFHPVLEDWQEACSIYPYIKQICEHFEVCHETVRQFIDKEYVKQEQDSSYISRYIEALTAEKKRFRKTISTSFLKSVEKGDNPTIIFGMKSFHGTIEAKDLAHIELKRQELALKSNEYLTKLAEKYSLNFEELKEFSEKYFKGIDLEYF